MSRLGSLMALQRVGIHSEALRILVQKAPPTGWVPSWSKAIMPGVTYLIFIGTEEQMQEYCNVESVYAMEIRFPVERLLGDGRFSGAAGGMMTYRFRTSTEDKILQVLHRQSQ